MLHEDMDQEGGLPSYLNRLTQAPLLTPDEEVTLTEAAQKGCKASKQRLVESNMRLVINIAKSYRCRAVPLEDLIQEGAIGLMHAIDRFDPDKGFRFSTYATHWVRQAIGRAIDNKAKAIRLPAHISQTLRKIERERVLLMREMGSEPSPEQIAQRIGISAKKLVTLMHAAQELVSLDARVGENENTTLGNLLRDEQSGDPEMEVMGEETMREIHSILKELNERERRVMTYKLRIETDAEAETMRDDLAREMQLSRERIRQIEVQAIKKLRAVAQRRRLREMLSH